MRIIDADIIMADLNGRADYADMLIKDMKDYIAEQPTIDLIHCSDCRFRYGSSCTRFAEIPITLDDYCSRGKKK